MIKEDDLDKADVVDSIKSAIIYLMRTTDWNKIKVAKLCEVASVSRSSFYRAHDSIEDVVRSSVVMPPEKKSLYIAYACGGHYRLVYRWLKELPEVSVADIAKMMNELLHSVLAI